MTANDPGHINNLSETEDRQLRELWAQILSTWSDPDADLSQYAARTNTSDDDGNASIASAARAQRTMSVSSTVSSVSSGARSIFNGIRSWSGFGGAAATPEKSKEDGAEDLAAEQLQDASAEDFSDASAYPVSNTQMLYQLYFLCGAERPDVLPLRFLRARKWVNSNAFTMLSNCLKWRQKVDIQTLLQMDESVVAPRIFEEGHAYYLPEPDKQGRPVHIIHAAKHSRYDPLLETSRYTVFVMELARAFLRPPVENYSLVFDMTDFGLKNMDFPFVKLLVDCLEAYYPESLGVMLIVNAPWVFNSIWRIIAPWFDPVVRAKIQFCTVEELPNWVDRERLPVSLGGTYEYKYVEADAEEKEKSDKIVGDKEGREAKEKEWKEAWEKLRVATREWIIAGAAQDWVSSSDGEAEKDTRSQAFESAKKQREGAAQAAQDSFKRFYVQARRPGLYHRVGMLSGEV